MRLLALLALAPLLSLASSTASVEVSGDDALTFADGSAYVMAFDGFGVMALATAPLADGVWAHGDSAFSYVEVRVFSDIREGEVALGQGASVGLYHWGPGGEEVEGRPFYEVASGTLTFTEVSDSLAVGTIDADLTRMDLASGADSPATLAATFRAVPGNIPAP